MTEKTDAGETLEYFPNVPEGLDDPHPGRLDITKKRGPALNFGRGLL